MGSVGEDEDADSKNLWASILTEVQSSSASKLPTSKSVLVLGDNESGKTTLIAKLQGTEDPKKGVGLEYYYIDVKDEYGDEQAHLSVWALDGDLNHTGLLKYALSESNFEHTIVMIVASMANPWSIMETIEKWVTVLQQHLDRLKISPEARKAYEQSLIRFFQEYTEPDESHSVTQSTSRRDVNPLHPHSSNSTSEEDGGLLPLGENILSQNLGIPIVVVITKSDAISTLEKDHDFREEHFDFIQQHIRKFCLNYGAALCYTSVKEEKNCDLLHKYLLHRVYGFPFTKSAHVVDKDSVFIPTGWDNEKKVAILYENLASMKATDSFEDVIAKPITRKPVQRDAEIAIEDEQLFLMKQQTQLSKQPPPGAATESPVRPAASGSPVQRAGSTPSPVQNASPKKLEAKQPTSTSEGMLANFFNSLLSKKTGAPGPSRSDSTAARDAAAELERMTKSKPSKRALSETNPNGPSSSES
ncbi:hypothetical protein CHS0354_008647 [Potamilus streckersoni]|uniref:Dynein light intermediate chain n=1 Tax=Potamilus streckersoni TaxID=2493646 RepID=A0AAE0TH99_9BIVA|nr:hypothetical protein CHS0354_008647 [Potamilus streckersoni]